MSVPNPNQLYWVITQMEGQFSSDKTVRVSSPPRHNEWAGAIGLAGSPATVQHNVNALMTNYWTLFLPPSTSLLFSYVVVLLVEMRIFVQQIPIVRSTISILYLE